MSRIGNPLIRHPRHHRTAATRGLERVQTIGEISRLRIQQCVCVCVVCVRPEGLIIGNARLTKQALVIRSPPISADMLDYILIVDISKPYITTEMLYLGDFEDR